MPLPVLIDTDMGVDDAVAVVTALLSDRLDVKGIVSVGGNVPLLQATQNIGRLLGAVGVEAWPAVGVGLDQHEPDLQDAREIFGSDGFGETDWPIAENFKPQPYTKVYRNVIESCGSDLTIICIGPLTNLAAFYMQHPVLLRRVHRIVVMGGALWCRGNVAGVAEFNFYRDPEAAEMILSAGLPVTLVPLDATQFVQIDEFHYARLTVSDQPAARFLSSILARPLRSDAGDAPAGRLTLHDAVAVGSLIWPELFLRTTLPVSVEADWPDRGRCRVLSRSSAARPPVSVLTTVGAVDFIENLLGLLCGQRFVV